MHTADELVCRFSNTKIDLLTHFGRHYVLPSGFWGGIDQNEGDKQLFLTFDDGPHPHTTNHLLELLEHENLKATFFLIGSNCAKYPDLVKRIHDAGHVIGNHSFGHQFMPLLATKHLEREVVATNKVIEEITGSRPTIFRPPYGIIDKRTGDCLKEQGMTPVYWHSAPEDWLIPGAHRIVRRVMWKIKDGGQLIVLHEGAHLGRQTGLAVREIISKSKSQGYQFSKVKVRA